MKRVTIPGLNKPVARLIQGTVMIGTKTLDAGFALLDAIFEQGGNTFDTAHVYGQGDNERAFGRWLQARGNRDQVVIIGKGAHHSEDRRRVTPFDITADLHDSLARMRVDHIDIYLLHRDDPSMPVGPIVEVLNEHQRAGKISVFGGSNWTHRRIAAANAYAAERGLTGFAVSSPHFSLAEQVQEPWPECVSIAGKGGEAARAWYADRQMALFTWSSLAGGFFSGRFTPQNLDTFTAYLDRLCVTSYCYADNFRRLERVQVLARERGLTPAQVALAYVLNQPLNIFALIGAGTPDEFRQSVAALGLTLTPDEMAWLDLRSDTERVL